MSDLAPTTDVVSVVNGLTEQGIETVVLAGADTHGVMRGKRVPIGQLTRLLAHGVALCDVFWVLHLDESALVARPAGHVGYFPTDLGVASRTGVVVSSSDIASDIGAAILAKGGNAVVTSLTPLDPGRHRIEATAEKAGFASITVVLPEGATKDVELPIPAVFEQKSTTGAKKAGGLTAVLGAGALLLGAITGISATVQTKDLSAACGGNVSFFDICNGRATSFYCM